MDQLYNRLYGKSRAVSTSPARAETVPAVGPRAVSAPPTAAEVSEVTPASALPRSSAEEEAQQRQELALWQQTATTLAQAARHNPHGVQVLVRTSLNVTQSIYAGTPPSTARTTKLVRQCLDDFRTAVLLGRDWLHHGTGFRGSETAGQRTSRRIPEGLDEEASVLLLKLLKWEASVAPGRTHTHTHTHTTSDAQPAPPVPPPSHHVVESQLLAWLVAQSKGSVGGRFSDHDAAALLLSQQLRYKPLLEDLCILAAHLLVPLDVVRHQHRWLFVSEDVSLTLRDRLHHHRVVLRERAATIPSRQSVRATSGAASSASGPTSPTVLGVMPVEEVRRLWQALWGVLGAAWRQRDRLLGAYGHLHGPRACEAVLVGPGARARPLPPSGGATPLSKTRYARAVKRASMASAPAAAESARPPAYPCEDDTCAFGPLTPARIGVSASRGYVVREALAAVLRSLRVERPASASSAPAMARSPGRSRASSPHASPRPTGLSVFSAASTPRPSRAPSVFFDSPIDAPARALAPGQRPTQPASSEACTAWLFDPLDEDAETLVAPYVSPEWFVYTQKRRQQQQKQKQKQQQEQPSPQSDRPCADQWGGDGDDGLPGAVPWAETVCISHCFSDDAWSAAVLTVEAALCGFDVARSHIAVAVCASSSSAVGAAAAPLTGSVFADVAAVLTTHCRLSRDAACNFLYAALHFFSRAVLAFASDPLKEETGAAPTTTNATTAPSPQQMANEWLACVRGAYGDAFVTTTMAEVCDSGLQWRRAARWAAFVDAHARGGGAAEASLTTPEAPDARAVHAPPRAVLRRPFVPPPPPEAALLTRAAAQRLERALDALQVPLLALFPGTVADAVALERRPDQGAAAASPSLSSLSSSSSSVWWTAPLLSSAESRLQQWHACVESRAGSSRSHGGDEGEAAAFTAWVALCRRALLLECLAELSAPTGAIAARKVRPAPEEVEESTGTKTNTSVSARVWTSVRAGHVRHWVTAHPFTRHVIEGSQLPALRAVATASTTRTDNDTDDANGGGGGGLPRAARLFVPMCTLDQLMRDGVDAEDGRLGSGQPPHTDSTRTSPHHGSPVKPLRPLACLEVYLGDHWRTSLPQLATSLSLVSGGGAGAAAHTRAESQLAGPARREAEARRQTESYYSIVTAAHGGGHVIGSPRPVVPTPLVRRALETVMRPLDLSVTAQLTQVAALRQHLLAWTAAASSATTPSALSTAPASVAQQLRRYLMDRHAEGLASHGASVASYAVPIPATLRATCWAALLHVPSAKRRAKVFDALPLFEAALSDRQIALDVPRCHQYHPLLSSREGREKLSRVIKAWLLLSQGAETHNGTHQSNKGDSSGPCEEAEERLYWQGVDSVCAVLLTVAYTDEPLVVFLLDELLQRYVPHKEESGGSGSGGRAAMPATSLAASARLPSVGPGWPTAALDPVRANSMADQLAQFEVLLAYVDPLLATHVFGVLECRPGLFAISWFLTLLAHNLPLGQVYPLWDFVLLYMDDYPHCFVCLCCALLLSQREVLLSQDLSACLTTLGRLAHQLAVPTLLVNAAVLMQAVPPSLRFASPLLGARPVSPPSSSTTAAAGASAGCIGCLPVAALVGLMQRTGGHTAASDEGPCRFPVHLDWGDAGLYLVDLRPASPMLTAADGTRYREYMIGALPVPLAAPLVLSDGGAMAEGGGHDDDDDGGTDAASTRARALAARQAVLEFQRRVEEAAAEVARQVQVTGVVMTTVPPRPAPNGLEADIEAALTPMTVKTWHAPHIVLVGVSPSSSSSSSSLSAAASATTGWEVSGHLARQLVAFGMHKVSVLLGGFEAVKREAPKLIVRVVEETNRV